MPTLRYLGAATLLLVFACSNSGLRQETPAETLEYGAFHRSITTRSAAAQKAFDDGLLLCFGFTHEEALRRFDAALVEDPTCAMAYWGIALASGPHINNPNIDDKSSTRAKLNVRLAIENSQGLTAIETDLINALETRYAGPETKRAQLDRDYSAAMKILFERYPNDADIGALYAESMMNLRPWDLWLADGTPRPETPEIIRVLEHVLAIDPNHPGALHFIIHALEASPYPERAEIHADRLRARAPGIGHLVHMPSHIDALVGRYDEGIDANWKAIAADLAMVRRSGPGGLFMFYRAHNYHMGAYLAMFAGRRKDALDLAAGVLETLPVETVLTMPDMMEAFRAVPYHVYVRFGLWDEILAQPEPEPRLVSTRMFHHYARTVALSASGYLEEARRSLATFEAQAAVIPATATLGNNKIKSMIPIARAMAAGELAYREGRHDEAFALLRTAVEARDQLRYDEPAGWMQPVRHALGALLLEQGRVDEAEVVYRDDLKQHPKNGWALHGLAECRRRAGDIGEAEKLEGEFRAAFFRADIELKSSCFCRQK